MRHRIGRFNLSWLRSRLDPFKSLPGDIREMQLAHLRGQGRRAHLYRVLIFYRYNCCISPSSAIAADVEFPHPVGIVIGDGAVIGPKCVIFQNVTLGRRDMLTEGYPELKEGCVLYAGSTVVGDIVLESGTVVAAGAVVTRGTGKKNDVLVGIPARSRLM